MTCKNGHDAEREFRSGRMRCLECYREGNRRRAQRRRDADKGILPAVSAAHRCPYCHLVPCLCEEL